MPFGRGPFSFGGFDFCALDSLELLDVTLVSGASFLTGSCICDSRSERKALLFREVDWPLICCSGPESRTLRRSGRWRILRLPDEQNRAFC